MPPNGKPKKVGVGQVDPAWKVLQMKMREQQTLENGKKVTRATSVKQKITARKRKFEMEKAAVAGKRTKVTEEEDTIVISSNRDKGLPTSIMALDCEYVGVGEGGSEDSLARVSIVNEQGKVVYDQFVQSRDKVTDYRTAFSGIRPFNLTNAPSFEKVRSEVCKLLSDRTVIGHALHNDFRVLQLTHPKKLTRDMAKIKFLQNEVKSKKPSLKLYAEKLLGIQIQQGEHDSVTDARVALRIYQMHKKKIEDELARYK